MAIFKVGDRVRIVRSSSPEMVGREATIIGFVEACHVVYGVGWFYDLRVDDIGTINARGLQIAYPRDCLAPLTPPGQKEFKAEDILHLPNLPDFKTMTPEFARAWGGA